LIKASALPREKPLSCNLDQFPFYGNWTHTVLGGLVLASHPQLPGDLFDLKRDLYVDRLVSYRWYQYMLG
jgi:hypothetical protein